MEEQVTNLEKLRKKIARLLTIIIVISVSVTVFLVILFRDALGPGLFVSILVGGGCEF